MNLKEKVKRDRKAVLKYKAQLEAQREEIHQYAQAYSMTGRRARAEAVGECVLQLMDSLKELSRKKKLLDGTLFWNIEQQKVKDTDGKKGFKYLVIWHVKTHEPKYTHEQINEEVRKTYRQMREETEEMYREEYDKLMADDLEEN